MKIKEILKKWGLIGLSFKAPFIEAEWAPDDADRQAAWDIYVELVTRIATQELASDDGRNDVALQSIYQLFPLTRDTLKQHGPDCARLARIAIVMLNQRVRPFTGKWHKRISAQPLSEEEHREFRAELAVLQGELSNYTGLLADLAGVENTDELTGD